MDRVLLEEHPPEAFIFPGKQRVFAQCCGLLPHCLQSGGGLWAAVGAVKAECGTLLGLLMGCPRARLVGTRVS